MLSSSFLLKLPMQTNKVYYEWATRSAYTITSYGLCFNCIKGQENVMAYLTVTVYNWDVKYTAVFGDMKALMCCQRFTFFRHVICFNKSTHTDKALQSCHLYPMSEASFSDLAATQLCSPYLASQSWNVVVCGGHNQRTQLSSAV